MGVALYRKYRSKSLGEVIGQDHVTRTLKNSLDSGNINHAYLLTGPRGVGKTSVARILAHEVNNIPYNEDSIHLDIIEIDAASNRRIDEIRELRDKVHNAPTSAKYKVYIIDEVHMLTKEAFNALLKTLEEPPSHAIFILATTESHKLPETIISRCLRLSFRPIETRSATKHLQTIAEKEGIDISEDAVELIVEHGQGSFRDSISLLDQVRGFGAKIALKDVQTLLGIAPQEAVDEIFTALNNHDLSNVIKTLSDLKEKGYNASNIAKQLSDSIRSTIKSNNSLDNTRLYFKILEKLLQVPSSNDPFQLLEIILLSAILDNDKTAPNPSSNKQTQSSNDPQTEPNLEAVEYIEPALSSVLPQEATTDELKPIKQSELEETSQKIWDDFLDALKAKHTSLYSVARMANPSFEKNNITLQFNFGFHFKKFDDSKTKALISDILKSTTGKPYSVNIVLSEKKGIKKPKPLVQTQSDPTIKTISNIFGGAELLES